MTEPTRPDDRELEKYVEGGSTLSARYREASREGTPPELDDVVLAQARAELRRKPNVNRYLAPVALAASLVLAVNLAWNLYEIDKAPSAPALEEALPAEQPVPVAVAPAPAPPPAVKPEPVLRKQAAAEGERQAAAQAQAEQRASAERKEVESVQKAMLQAADSAGAAAPAAAEVRAEPLTEEQKIDRLVAHIAGLDGAVFIRNEKEYGPAEAARHLRYKREKAGERVKTADDFIRLCASHSYLSGEAYLIRLGDGRTRTAEDVLREELARLEGQR